MISDQGFIDGQVEFGDQGPRLMIDAPDLPDVGCDCRVTSDSSDTPMGLGMLLLAILSVRRRTLRRWLG